MRVILTEMYFDDVSGVERRPRYWRRGGDEESNPGLAFAWFHSDQPGPFDIESDKRFRGKEIDPEEVRPVLDALLRDIDGRDIVLGRERVVGRVQNSAIVDFIYEQTIVIEQSPPEGIRFKDLLKRTNAPVYVGTFIGIGASFDQPPLMILTIPLGIIVVGSALGISEAMAIGLNKSIKRMFDRRKEK